MKSIVKGNRNSSESNNKRVLLISLIELTGHIILQRGKQKVATICPYVQNIFKGKDLNLEGVTTKKFFYNV